MLLICISQLKICSVVGVLLFNFGILILAINRRGFSTFHAIVVAAGSLYLLLVSDLFIDAQDGLFINRTSTLSDTILGVC